MQQKQPMDAMISAADSNEYVNAISHLIGAILSLSALALLVTLAALEHKWLHVVGFAVYGTTMLLSFIASALLHFFLLFGRYRRVFGVLDHCAIYLLIAGTYTPFCLAVLDPVPGWTLFAVVWSLAIFFIALKAIFFVRMPNWFSNLTYISMGWLVAFCFWPIYTRLGVEAVVLMTIGGLCYTLGALSFAGGRPNPFPPFFGNHEIWHLAVLAGSAIFFAVMLLFVLPYGTAL